MFDSEDRGNLFEGRRAIRNSSWLAILGAIADHAQWIGLLHDIANPVLRLDGGHLPDRRARREHFDQREAEPVHLVLNCPLDGARGLRNLLVIAKADALDIDRSIERRQQFAHAQRIALIGRAATLRAWSCSSGPAAL